ncbi:hypothetical protein MSAN_01452400 [Mycena sanguinolenta]|uniref:Uncharacterized protein n=1 Tax=Mycena sanguinolenta TaxID=230812 RepID=A0A8H6Y8U6_9AGAR|nr:hypothetical protein MSAN_01452400 [Mycena sanguinolenta]
MRLAQVRKFIGWFDDRDDDTHCPFDCSRLAILSADDIPTLIFAWLQIAPSLQNLEALEFHTLYSINLSLFPNLLFLGIQSVVFRTVVDVLLTIPSSSRIQEIVLNTSCPIVDECDELDAVVSSLPVQCLPAVGLEMDLGQYTHVWAASFPRLRSKNLLYHADCCWLGAQLRRQNAPH